MPGGLVLVEGWGFLSGILPVSLDDERAALPEQVEQQTKQILANMERMLGSSGLDRSHVVSVRIDLVEFARFYERMDRAYAGFFSQARVPARSCVGVSALPRGALVAMDFIAKKPAS
jgi:2-iminobutanoate/2-iminopropanoate deaminase